MPRPPILPVLDWQSLVQKGETFEVWLHSMRSPDIRRQFEERSQGLPIEPQIQSALRLLPRNVYVVAIAEDWCGDVVRHVPLLEGMARCSRRIHIRYLSRTAAPDVFIRFLTNGGEAIPKFVFLSDTFVECGNWGPMPLSCRDWIARGKACGDVSTARKQVAALYDADPELREAARELLHCIEIASTPAIPLPE